MTAVSGNSRFLRTGFRTGAVAGVELPKEVFTYGARWMPLIVEWNTSANMFYLLKHFLSLILVIFKLKCNNLIFNKIMILNDLYVCLMHCCFIENPPVWILDDGPLIFWGGSITAEL
jgi:hypothetical protein